MEGNKQVSAKELAKQLGLLRKRPVVFGSPRLKTKKKKNVEFPAVLMNTKTGQIESEFHHYLQPSEKPTLSSFCQKLTGITQTQVDDGIPLSLCLRKFSTWLRNLRVNKGIVCASDKTADSKDVPDGQKVAAMVTWSDWDLGCCLLYETKRKQITFPSELDRWIDLRLTYKKFYDRKPDGLNGALQDLGLLFDGRQHSGVDDARNTARAAWRMICDGCCLDLTKTLKMSTNGSVQRISSLLSTQRTGRFTKNPAEQTKLQTSNKSIKCGSFDVALDKSLPQMSRPSPIKQKRGLQMRDPNIIHSTKKPSREINNTCLSISTDLKKITQKKVIGNHNAKAFPLKLKTGQKLSQSPKNVVCSSKMSKIPVLIHRNLKTNSSQFKACNIKNEESKHHSILSSTLGLCNHPNTSSLNGSRSFHTNQVKEGTDLNVNLELESEHNSDKFIDITKALESNNEPNKIASNCKAYRPPMNVVSCGMNSIEDKGTAILTTSKNGDLMNNMTKSIIHPYKDHNFSDVKSEIKVPKSTSTINCITPTSRYTKPSTDVTTKPSKILNDVKKVVNHSSFLSRSTVCVHKRSKSESPNISAMSNSFISPVNCKIFPLKSASLSNPEYCRNTSLTLMHATPPLCKCGRRSKRHLVHKQGPNKGRWFFSCSTSSSNNLGKKSKQGCKFFQWDSP